MIGVSQVISVAADGSTDAATDGASDAAVDGATEAPPRTARWSQHPRPHSGDDDGQTREQGQTEALLHVSSSKPCRPWSRLDASWRPGIRSDRISPVGTDGASYRMADVLGILRR